LKISQKSWKISENFRKSWKFPKIMKISENLKNLKKSWKFPEILKNFGKSWKFRENFLFRVNHENAEKIRQKILFDVFSLNFTHHVKFTKLIFFHPKNRIKISLEFLDQIKNVVRLCNLNFLEFSTKIFIKNYNFMKKKKIDYYLPQTWQDVVWNFCLDDFWIF